MVSGFDFPLNQSIDTVNGLICWNIEPTWTNSMGYAWVPSTWDLYFYPLTGWWLTYPSEKSWSESQLGWWHSHIYDYPLYIMENKKCSKPPTRFWVFPYILRMYFPPEIFPILGRLSELHATQVAATSVLGLWHSHLKMTFKEKGPGWPLSNPITGPNYVEISWDFLLNHGF